VAITSDQYFACIAYFRKEVLKENVSSGQRKNFDMDLGQESHLEEYMSQDEQVEWEENVSPLKDLDELLLQISKIC
jgi:hypothetical protein